MGAKMGRVGVIFLVVVQLRVQELFIQLRYLRR